MKMRESKGLGGHGVNLVAMAQETGITDFIRHSLERALVYDTREAGKAELEGLMAVVAKAGHADRTLLVYDDVAEKQKAFAFLGAINTLLERKQIPQGAQSASSILAFVENISIDAEARKAIEQAA
jgi:hypothetical protein